MKKRLILLAILIITAGLVWVFVLTKTFLIVSTDTGTFAVYENGVEKIHAHKDGVVYLEKGHYTIASIKDDTPVALSYVATTLLPWQTVHVSSTESTTPLKPQLLLGRSASMVTSLAGGYIYKNTETRGIEYASKDGIKDISDLFGITSKDLTESTDMYNAVVNIEHDDSTVYVTTTRAIYKFAALDSIQKSAFSDTLIIRSSLNSKAKKITFIAFSGNGSYSAYSLRTNDITGALQQVFSGSLLINSVTSSGDNALVYNDNVPSADSTTAKSFETKKQVTPKLVNLTTLEPTTIKGMPRTAIASASLSSDGTYLAYRTKMSDHIVIVGVADGKVATTLPATTLTKLQWKGDTFVYNYGAMLLSYTPGADSSTVTMVTQQQITDFTYDNVTPIVSTNKNFTFAGVASATKVDANEIALINSIENYTLAFSAVNDSLVIYRSCAGAYVEFDDCTTGSTYAKTLQQLAKIGDTTSALQDVTNDFFVGNYSFSK